MAPHAAAGNSASTAFTNVSNNTHPQWWKDPGLRKLNILLLSSFLGSIANGYDVSLISGLEAIPRWFRDFTGLNDANTLGLVIAAYTFAGLVSFLPAVWVVDKFGRRWGIIIGNAGIISAVLGQCFCTTAVQFLGTRLVLGFFSIFNSIGSTALLAELAHPRQRAIVGALYNTFFFVGSITAAWTSFGTHNLNSDWSWRTPVITQLFWTSVQVIFVLFVPESPRWLVRNKRPSEARQILTKYHANGIEDDELVVLEFSEICTSIELTQDKPVGWMSLLATPGNRKRVIICIALGLSTQWVGNAIISYYFAPVLETVGITSATQQQGINGGLQVYNWILAITGALLAERAGRRRLFLVSTCTMLLFMILVLTCSAVFANTGSHAAGTAVIVFLFLFLGGYVIGLTPIPLLYINEIWPTDLRAKGASVYWFSSTAALCFNQYVNPIALREIQWRYYFMYIGVLIAVIAFIFFYVPETKGRSLEEVAGIFDGKYADAFSHPILVASTKGEEDGPRVSAVEAVA
ncbi:general substrate transporter [Xylogone sp. PMI_703]|nr:general substrate transporter [Xylogone sp. PMI_703]